ncbi:hypothetical protein NQZ68_016118 [Dissostichus eleginoides]|nr:hypothetical protein NQZ68_016118 [Dissostichus eleginoides]
MRVDGIIIIYCLAEEWDGGACASTHMRIRWETRLKTGSYAVRCRKRAGRVRLEQRQEEYRRTDPGTAAPGVS